MTDKQIIIDGVDVSGCEFYLPYSEKCECIVDDNGNNNLFCREYRDCYYKRMYHTGQEKDIYKNENKELYKQLKRKEQECDRLNNDNHTLLVTRQKLLNDLWIAEESLKDYKEHYDKQCDELNQLKAENDKYSLFIEKLCDYAGLECDNEEQAMRTLSDLASQINKARWIIDRYKQTLTEIKEVINEFAKKDILTFPDYSRKENYKIIQRQYSEPIEQIYQKISECEGNDEQS